MNVVAIIQARMGSTRLPGKVMMQLVGKTVLEHVITRVKQSKLIDEIVIATTTKLDDNVIVEEAKRLGVKYFRGSEEDVLGRYYYAAKENKADIVVRITSDCPIIDPHIMDQMLVKFIDLYNQGEIDYMSNTLKQCFPRGLDVEVFTLDALEKAFRNGNLEYEREHVTPYIYRNLDKFKVRAFISNINHSNYRWTLDTVEDFQIIDTIYKELYIGNKVFLYKDIIDFISQNPHLSKINENIKQKKIEE